MSEQVIKLLITGTLDTLQMTVISTIMAMIIGLTKNSFINIKIMPKYKHHNIMYAIFQLIQVV